MDFPGWAMKGMAYVALVGIDFDVELANWIDLAENFFASLPPKEPK